MGIVRCLKEHAYDEKAYTSCPICNSVNVLIKDKPGCLRMPFEYLRDGYVLSSRYTIEKVYEEDFMYITYLALDSQNKSRVLIDELYPLNTVFRNCNDSCDVSHSGIEGTRRFNYALTLIKQDGVKKKYNWISSPIDSINTNHTIYLVYDYLQWQTLKEFLQTKREELSANEIFHMINPFTKELIKTHQENKFHRNISIQTALISGSKEILLPRSEYARIKFLRETQGKDEEDDVLKVALLISELLETGVHRKENTTEISELVFKKDPERKKKALGYINNCIQAGRPTITISNLCAQIGDILFTQTVPTTKPVNYTTSINIDDQITDIENKIKGRGKKYLLITAFIFVLLFIFYNLGRS